ncbi:arylamine N-acetyltransferase [Cytobacillus sp. IB215665]|uniref:arylamine N-acetyltransferase n=1 Tax=Cytobacillus sp. IB215665 TaxID=3097357 RepID=UPI002A166CB5|nr:arylamine N-acetyltransferase [Cytobacillus sp. IB215665]MDX8365565.1 arylamine N-acetyltransferase [Cytobacillus sp. IB215665]
MNNAKLIDNVLGFLSVKRGDVNLELLNKLVRNHQMKVKWETLSKIIDWEKGERTGDFLPSVETYFERVIEKGMGGTCWTHSLGFHWLLSKLGFSVHYVYMDPGHLCLRVDLDTAYYIDVGYCAPLFQSYPMFESFQVLDGREQFNYVVSNEMIKVERKPGPTKTLNPEPVVLRDLQHIIKRSNDWQASPVLREIQVYGYIDGVPTHLKNNIIKQYFKYGKIECELNEEEREEWIIGRFGIDKSIYLNALSVYKEMMK